MRWQLGAIALLAACSSPTQTGNDPGRVTLHKLNNAEYNNTVRDLTGTGLTPATEFPADDRAYGFDTLADVLRVSTLGLELYETAAANILDDVLAVNIQATTQQFELMGSDQSGATQNGGWFFFSAGTAPLQFVAAGPGRYHFTFRAYQTKAGTDDAQISIDVPGMSQLLIPVPAVQASPGLYETDLTFPAGTQAISIGFANDFYDDTVTPAADRNLWIDYVKIEGPFDGPSVDEGRRGKIFTCANLSDATCQDQILAGFAKRAWRRPPREPEITRLKQLVADAVARGGTAEEGVRTALQAILVSPHFLYRVEVDPTPNDKTPHPLNAWELASRLSYFLWSSMPDDELFAAAESGALLDPTELEAQVRRMIASPKAVALVDNFSGQWLFTRAVGSQDPDYALFPEYDDELEEAMRQETRHYFQAFIDEDLPMTQFLTADFTYVNDRLAEFYGLPLPGTNSFVRVDLGDAPRRGFLGQASILRVTSRPKRTSPVLRGKWVLDNLLCAPPPPPPPGVESFEETMAAGTLRERLIQHQTNPVCASCHSVMDPIGFALDNYDAIGKYRTQDQGAPIDATGLLFGKPFENAIDLGAELAKQPNVYRCMVEKLYAYSGRLPLKVDAVEHITELTQMFVDSNYSFRELIVAMATHISFTHRRGEP